MLFKAFTATFLLLCAATCNAATLYLVGDSTMAIGGGGSGTEGWGQVLAPFFTIPVVDKAIAGRSARSYTTEGHFNDLFAIVKSGDWVVIEFGHNDGTSNPDNGRSDCPGNSVTATCTVVDNGVSVVTHTFNFYVQNAVTTLASKGVKTVVSSVTPDNGFPFGPASSNRFVGFASLAASRTGADFVDHYSYVVQAYNALGEKTVNTFYPIDHTHTSAAGALVVAEAFVKGLSCGTSKLKASLSSASKNIPNGCL
ncbi:rhamnogalacturonan acetylesterase [Rickenella mellea]|uniref:Rhamnogalacturonan acetylesterase n=1 Tax=Rickenella mellea TaxID=50990 RepID=A0A4Y7PJP1_9AGAM|nr:rhamnogalacturonan acetylesterase [Rickenella mellea]